MLSDSRTPTLTTSRDNKREPAMTPGWLLEQLPAAAAVAAEPAVPGILAAVGLRRPLGRGQGNTSTDTSIKFRTSMN